MIGYTYFVALHGLLGVIALITFWSAALLKKGSPKHRAIGKVFLLAMAGIVVSGVPLVIQAAFFRNQLGVALFLTFLLPLTAQACWTAWRAVTDKRDWQGLVARRGWQLAKWVPALLAIPVLWVGARSGQMIFVGFAIIPLVTGFNMHRFEKKGPQRGNWHVVMHYQAMLGAGIATHVAFLSIAMKPAWRWLSTHTEVPSGLIQVFPWFAPVGVAILAGVYLGRKYNRPASPRTKTRVATTPLAERVD